MFVVIQTTNMFPVMASMLCHFIRSNRWRSSSALIEESDVFLFWGLSVLVKQLYIVSFIFCNLQGLHTAGLQNSSGETTACPSFYRNTHFGSAKLHPSVQLRPQVIIWQEHTKRLACRRLQPLSFKLDDSIELRQQQQQEVRATASADLL